MTWVRLLACITLDFRQSLVFILVVSLMSEEQTGYNLLSSLFWVFFFFFARIHLSISQASEQTVCIISCNKLDR